MAIDAIGFSSVLASKLGGVKKMGMLIGPL